jgi:hypothetical protein
LTWFVQAHLVDEPDLASSPNVSSSLDDIFFIVKKVLHRVVSTANVANLLIFNKELRIVLDQDVAEIWRARIEGAFKDLAAIASSQNSMAIGVGGISGVAAIAGRGREEERERREKEARTTFIVSRRSTLTLEPTCRGINAVEGSSLLLAAHRCT